MRVGAAPVEDRTASRRPCCGSDSTRHEQVGKSYHLPMFAIPTLCLCVFLVFFGTVDMIYYTVYNIYIYTAVQYCTVPLLVCISGACCTLWREGII